MKNQLFALLAIIAITLSSCKQSDSKIQSNVQSKLSETPATSSISASVSNGVVTLTGTVPDSSVALQAEATSRSVKGVKSVQDNITVTLPTPPVDTTATTQSTSSDATLNEGVQAAVKDYKDVKATVKDGTVTLTGTATPEQNKAILQSVNALHPTKINNEIKIKK